MFERIFSSAKDKAAAETTPDDARLDEDVPLEWGDNRECVGEIVVDSAAGPSELRAALELCETTIHGKILQMSRGREGTAILCAIPDVPSFLVALQRIPKLTGWVLKYR